MQCGLLDQSTSTITHSRYHSNGSKRKHKQKKKREEKENLEIITESEPEGTEFTSGYRGTNCSRTVVGAEQDLSSLLKFFFFAKEMHTMYVMYDVRIDLSLS